MRSRGLIGTTYSVRVAALFVGAVIASQGTVRAQQCVEYRQAATTLNDQILTGIPPQMLSILKELQKNTLRVCGRAYRQLEPRDYVDPMIPTARAGTAFPIPGTFVEKEVLATVVGDGSNITAIAADLGLVELSRRQSGLLNAFVVRLAIPDGRSVQEVLSQLGADNRVEEAAPNHFYILQFDKIEKARFAPTKVNLDRSDNALSGRNVRIGIIDTAVDTDHPGLRQAVIEVYNVLRGIPLRTRKHGTAIAGLIGGRKLIRGVAPRAQLFVARAFDKGANEKARTSTAALIEALDWLVVKQLQIINMSFAGPRNTILSRTTRAVGRRGVLMVAAAGNNGPTAPAAYPAADPWVLAVTAIDIKDRLFKDANIGHYVFVSAPGVDVLVPTPDQGIDIVNGTSYAAAFVSGIAALMLEEHPQLTPKNIAMRMRSNALDLGEPGRDPLFGFGLVRAVSQAK